MAKYALYILTLLPVLALLTPAGAQLPQFQFQPAAFPVQINGWQTYSPLTGGVSESAPGFADIDGDGRLDMFVGNYEGMITYYHNNGTNTNPNFVFVTNNFAGVNLTGNLYAGRTTPVFIDLDGDGDLDLISGDFRGLLHYWRNDGTPQLAHFTHVTDTLQGIQVTGYSKPAFGDLDGDGVQDLLIGDYQGKIWYYHNIGTALSPNFNLVSNNWFGIDVGYNASPCLADIYGNGKLDLFIGDANGHISYYRNDGTPQNPNFTYVTNNWLGINVGSFANPKFTDIDGDGDLDLFIGREPTGWDGSKGDVYFYRNDGTARSPNFTFVTTNYLSLDLGYYTINPQLVDLNGDGLPELVVATPMHLDYFSNVGDLTQPSFVLTDENFQGISRPDIKPCFCDINGDGKLDLLAGESAIPGPPTIALYLNQGTTTSPNLVLYNANFITNPNFDTNVCPSVADIDGDGKLDLFVSDDVGHFFYYHNVGTLQWPNFQLVTNQWQNINYGYPDNGWKSLAFGDLDHNGTLDLVMCSWDYKNLRYYRNNGTPQSPNMVMVTDSLLSNSDTYYACPCLVDMDHDGNLDLFRSTYDGGIMYYRNITGDQPINPKYRPRPEPQIFLLPGSGNSGAAISFVLPRPQNITLDVFNLLGAKVATLASGLQPAGTYNYTWNALGRASGVYIVNLQTQEGVASKKLMVVK